MNVQKVLENQAVIVRNQCAIFTVLDQLAGAVLTDEEVLRLDEVIAELLGNENDRWEITDKGNDVLDSMEKDG